MTATRKQLQAQVHELRDTVHGRIYLEDRPHLGIRQDIQALKEGRFEDRSLLYNYGADVQKSLEGIFNLLVQLGLLTEVNEEEHNFGIWSATLSERNIAGEVTMKTHKYKLNPVKPTTTRSK